MGSLDSAVDWAIDIFAADRVCSGADEFLKGEAVDGAEGAAAFVAEDFAVFEGGVDAEDTFFFAFRAYFDYLCCSHPFTPWRCQPPEMI